MKIKYPQKLPHLPQIPNIIILRPLHNILNREDTEYTGFGRLMNDEKQIHQNYLINNDPQNLQDLKIILKNLKTTSQNPKFNLGIEIIQILLSHQRGEVIALALGNLFFIFNKRSIKNLIITELRIRANDPNPEVRKSAQYSLELIAEEIHKFEAFEIIYGLFSNVLLNLSYSFHMKWKLIVNSIIKNNYVTKYLNSLTDYFTHEILVILNSPLNILSLFIEEKIEDFSEDENLDNWLHYYLDIVKVEQTENPLNSLANIYAMTFLEKGHLRRLAALLDDEDSNVQMMGINGLIYAITTLLCTNYDQTRELSFLESIQKKFPQNFQNIIAPIGSK
jgi:hypothetical protein